jgi:hypothetical protein
VADEFVGENGGVCFDFDDVDCNGRNFAEDDTTQRVGEGEVDVAEDEVDVVV